MMQEERLFGGGEEVWIIAQSGMSCCESFADCGACAAERWSEG